MTEKTLWEWEAEFIRLLAQMKQTGIKIDRDFCRPRAIKGREICRVIEAELGWNPGSPKQIGEFLLKEMGYPVIKRTPNGNPSFDKEALEEYDQLLEIDGSDIAKKITRFRGWQKTVSTNHEAYLRLADRQDQIHPGYMVHGTRTGRISCREPNLQNIPRASEKEWNGDLKQGFVNRDKVLADWYSYRELPYPDLEQTIIIEADYSQIEMRLAAAVAKETDLLDAFNADIDIFQAMADKLGWTRQGCKLYTYTTLYGGGVDRVSLVFKIPKDEAQDMRNDFFAAYPRLKKVSDKATAKAKSQKYITYWTGRRRHLPYKEDWHKAFNSYIQGGAFEIVKRAGIRLAKAIPWPLVLTVHDSYCIELPVADFTLDNLQKIKDILEDVPESNEMGVKFKVSISQWGKK